MYLYNSNGDHVANKINQRLHNLKGDNIGYFIEHLNFFADLKGAYLGEIVLNNRLMFRIDNPFSGNNYGDRGDSGNIGSLGDPGNIGSIGDVSGYRNIKSKSN